jgi:PTH1 family peptidyl-tRNA hydrolase
VKYLITGLGNIGDEYKNTRHNIGFTILDAWAKASNSVFTDKRYGSVTTVKNRGRTYVLLKPSTFMNRSGNAINYWLKKEKIPFDKLLIVVDDISLPFGSIRLRPKGGDGGHNGLAHINSIFGHGNYARLRFGIGNDFYRGAQADYVLSEWHENEKELLGGRLELAIEMIKSFGAIGLELTMTKYNKVARINPEDADGAS